MLTPPMIFGFTILFMVVFYTVMLRKANMKKGGVYLEKLQLKYHNKYVKYWNNFLTRKHFRQIAANFSSYDCFSKADLEEKSVKLFETSVRNAALFPIVSLILMKDMTYCLLAFLLSYVYYTETVTKSLDNIYYAANIELSTCVQSIRERYLETSNIASAIVSCDKGIYLEKPLNKIYEMLMAADGRNQLLDFMRDAPIRKLKTLAIICYIKNDYGDTETETGSSFANDLITLRQEIDSEVRKLKETKTAFKFPPKLVLASLLVIPIAYSYLLTNIPGTTTLIKGAYGSVVSVVMIIVVTVMYYMINCFQHPTVLNASDVNSTILNLSRKKFFKEMINDLKPKTYKGRRRMRNLIEKCISSKTVEYVYMSKLIYSTALFIIGFILCCVFTMTYKEYILTNYAPYGFAMADYTERQYAQVVNLDEQYMNAPEKMDDEEAAKLVKGIVSGLSSVEIDTQVQRLSQKWDIYHNTTFKWWFVLVGLGCGIIGWFIPEVQLLVRKYIAQFEDDEDIMQLQNLMIVLCDTNMSVFDVLYWMEKQTSLHKVPIRYAYHEYYSDPLGSLFRLKTTAASVELKRLISKLESAAYNLSLQDAFSDIRLNKDNMLRLVEMIQKTSLEGKKSLVSFLSMIVIVLAIVLCFVLPILILGLSVLGESFNGIQNM